MPDKTLITGVGALYVINSINKLDGNVTTLDGNITAHNANVTTINGNITTLEGKITTLDGKITTLDGNITAHNANVTTINGNITTLDGKIMTLEGKITTLDGKITTLDGNITAHNANVTTINGNVTALDGKITTLDGNVTIFNGNAATLNGNVATLNGNVSTLNGNVTTLDGKITTLDNKVSTLDGKVSTLDGKVSTLNGILSDFVTLGLSLSSIVPPSALLAGFKPAWSWNFGNPGFFTTSSGNLETPPSVIPLLSSWIMPIANLEGGGITTQQVNDIFGITNGVRYNAAINVTTTGDLPVYVNSVVHFNRDIGTILEYDADTILTANGPALSLGQQSLLLFQDFSFGNYQRIPAVDGNGSATSEFIHAIVFKFNNTIDSLTSECWIRLNGGNIRKKSIGNSEIKIYLRYIPFTPPNSINIMKGSFIYNTFNTFKIFLDMSGNPNLSTSA
jgi:peptidoglycan hydrolase CwlO-like protein